MDADYRLVRNTLLRLEGAARTERVRGEMASAIASLDALESKRRMARSRERVARAELWCARNGNEKALVDAYNAGMCEGFERCAASLGDAWLT